MRGPYFVASLTTALFLGSIGAVRAQWIADRYMPTASERQELESGQDHLRASLAALRTKMEHRPTPDQLADAEIYLDAVERNLRQNLFFSPKYVDHARACLKEGEARVAALTLGKAPWERGHGLVAFGYRSTVDGSAQPYVVRIPANYDFDSRKAGRLDIHLHGRMGVMNELGYLNFAGWDGASYREEETPYLVLHPYGRGNNGWHFAGETDVFEAQAAVERRFKVDPNQIVLRGFSMGGHGCWHLGLQHPGDWAAMSPGAGFVGTKSFQHITTPLPAWEEPLLHLYDAVDYAANAANLPVLAYTGDQDPAIEQHRLMIAAMRQEQAPFREYIGPMTPHRYEPATRSALMTDLVGARRRPDARRVDFVTYTLRFPECKWIRIEGLERHWERAEVHANFENPRRIEVTTRNVQAVDLTLPTGLVPRAARLGKGPGALALAVDGENVSGGTLIPGKPLPLVKEKGHWTPGEQTGLRKRPGLQGPMDDALFGPVLAVRPTGTPWSARLDRWTGQELERFRSGWDEFFRATLPERADRTLTAEDIRTHNLYLFGDPGSNALLRRILPRLPLRWGKDEFEVAGHRYATEDHLPMLVFPNPENPERYVVINCGFSFSRADWRGSNALQYPHLPDYAVVKFDPDKFADDRRQDTVLAGFFDERWRIAR